MQWIEQGSYRSTGDQETYDAEKKINLYKFYHQELCRHCRLNKIWRAMVESSLFTKNNDNIA